MAGKPIETVAHVWNPKHISLRINVFPGIAIDANSYNDVNNDLQYFESHLKPAVA